MPKQLSQDGSDVPTAPTDRLFTRSSLIGWTVGELLLGHSLLGRNQQVPLARWPLLP